MEVIDGKIVLTFEPASHVEHHYGVAKGTMGALRKLTLMSRKRGDVNEAIAIEATKIRSKTGLRLPDALIIASAKATECAIIGTDKQWNNKDLGLQFYDMARL